MAAKKEKQPEEKDTGTSQSTRPVRDAAEKKFARTKKISPDMKGQTSEELIHELRVRQTELETQAKELRRIQHELEKSRYKYIDLYEFAPVGYLTLTNNGRLTEVNLTGAALLGVERKALTNHGFGQFIAPENLPQWDRFFMNVRLKEGKQVCNLMLKRSDGSTFPARLTGGRLNGGEGDAGILIAFSDITDIRKAEETVFRLRKEWESIFHAIGSPAIILAPDHSILAANTATCRLTGKTEEELRGVKCWEIFHGHGATRPPEGCPMERMLATKKHETADIEVGMLARTCLVSSTPLFGAEGSITSVIHIATDISEQKRTQEALWESEVKYRMLIETLNEGIWVIDKDAVTTFVNPKMAEILGYMVEEMEGRSLFSFMDDEGRRICEHNIERWQKGIKEQHDFEFLKKDGTRIYTSLEATPIKGKDGEYLGAIAGVADITERKRADEEIQKVHALLNETQAISRLGGWEYDVPTSRITWTDEVYRIHGVGCDYDPNNVNRNIGFYGLKDAPVIEQAFRRAVEDGEPYDLELELIRADGKPIWVRTMGKPVMKGGRVVRVNGNIMDITERKRAEKAREILLNYLAMKNTELEQFTYTVSHDLKSPLITIQGFLHLLEKDARAGDADRMHDDITRIHDAAKKMEDFIAALLELSRIGRIVNPPVNVVLASLVHDAAEQLDALIRERGVTLIIPDNLPEVYGDRVRLLQVFTNLLENAVKFMGDQNEPQVEISVCHKEGEEIICIQDNGIGIAPEHREKIFSTFTRLNPGIAGTGIGLALVNRIVEVHGGRCWVESEGKGKGSTFCFTLPKAHKAPRAGAGEGQ